MFQFLGVAIIVHGVTRWATLSGNGEEDRAAAAFMSMFIAICIGTIVLYSGAYLESWSKKQQ